MENINHADIENIKSQLQDLKKEHEKFDERIRAVETSKEKTEFQYEQIMQALDKLNEKTIPGLTKELNELKNKPVKRYETAVNAIISAIVAAVVGFLSTKL